MPDQKHTNWNQLALDLENLVNEAYQWLGNLTEDAVTQRPSDGQWSIKEIIGHLVDSATNNHQRFVRLQIADDLVFPNYSQDNDRWVALQGYGRTDWNALIKLWRHFNLHLARIIESVDERCIDHIWKMDENSSVTLGELMIDYPVHMKAHLQHIKALIS